MTEEQCKTCKYGYLDNFWAEGMDEELFWYDCDRTKDTVGEDFDYRYDGQCPYFEVKE